MRRLSDEEKAVFFRGYPTSRRARPRRLTGQEAAASMDEADAGYRVTEAVREAVRCVECDCAKKGNCGLRILATECHASPTAWEGARPRFERDTTHPLVTFEPGKCIKCGRCIAISRERKESLGLASIGRGFQVKVGVPFTGAIRDGLREAALECAEACPTGALAPQRGPGAQAKD